MARCSKHRPAGWLLTCARTMPWLSNTLALLLAYPAHAASKDANGPAGMDGLRLPASFRGTLPCADCKGIRHQLDLWPDEVFHLRREWLGKSEPLVRDDIGRWSYDAARKALVLRGGAEMPLQFEIKGPDRLRALDLQGRPIVSQLPYDLVSDGTLSPFEVAMWFGGSTDRLPDRPQLPDRDGGRLLRDGAGLHGRRPADQ